MPEPREHHLRVERTARYYSLGDESRKQKEMWIVIHGYRNLAKNFIEWFAPIASDAFIIAPEALSRFYTKGSGGPESPSAVGASWMTREDRDNEIEDYIAYFDRLYDTVQTVRPEKLVLLGFSQGCPAVMRWVAKGLVQPDHALIWSGDVPRDLDFNGYKANAKLMKSTWLVYGDADTTLDEAIYKEGEALLEAHGIPHETIRFSGGHEIKAESLVSVRSKLLSA